MTVRPRCSVSSTRERLCGRSPVCPEGSTPHPPTPLWKVVHVSRRRASRGDVHTSGEYALKVIDKSTPATEKQVAHLEAERNILRRIQHPFLVSYKGGYETGDKLHFVFDLCPGGEIFQKLKSQRYFSEAAPPNTLKAPTQWKQT